MSSQDMQTRMLEKYQKHAETRQARSHDTLLSMLLCSGVLDSEPLTYQHIAAACGIKPAEKPPNNQSTEHHSDLQGGEAGRDHMVSSKNTWIFLLCPNQSTTSPAALSDGHHIAPTQWSVGCHMRMNFCAKKSF